MQARKEFNKAMVALSVLGMVVVLFLAGVQGQVTPNPTPVNYYRNFDQSDDVDILVVEPGKVNTVTVQPVRHQCAEMITRVEVAGATNADYGPFTIGEPVILDDKSGWTFTVDTTDPQPPQHHAEVFQPDSHSISFVVGYKKLPRDFKRGSPRDASGFMGFYITTTPLVSDQVVKVAE